MADCVFCKIARGEVSAYKVYEDDSVLAFLDAQPINLGHTLVIPKNHSDEFQDMGEDLYDHVMHTAHQVARKIKSTLAPPRVGLWVHGFEVPHTHIHVVPLLDASDIRAKKEKSPDEKQMLEIADKLKE